MGNDSIWLLLADKGRHGLVFEAGIRPKEGVQWEEVHNGEVTSGWWRPRSSGLAAVGGT